MVYVFCRVDCFLRGFSSVVVRVVYQRGCGLSILYALSKREAVKSRDHSREVVFPQCSLPHLVQTHFKGHVVGNEMK